MTASRFSRAFWNPSRICSRSRALRRRYSARAPAHDLDAVVDEALEGVDDAHFARLAVDDGEHDDPEIHLHLRVFVQVIQDNFGIFAALELQHDAQAFAVALVADVGDALDFFLVDELGDLFDQAGLVHLVGQLGDDDGLAVLLDLFGEGAGADLERAAAFGVVVDDALASEDDAAGGEVRAGGQLEDFRHRGGGVLHEGDGGVDHLPEVVGRDAGGHADGDALAAVDEQVGEAGRENLGLDFAVVVVGAEIDGLLVDVLEQHRGDFGQPRLGVPHGRGRVGVDGAEVALAVDERIAHGEGLSHADEGVVDGAVAVRVVLAEHLADDLGALARGAVVGQPHFAHSVEDAPVDGLEAVADVGQSAADDDRHRVVEIRAAHLVFDVHRDDVFAFAQRQLFAAAALRRQVVRSLRSWHDLDSF